MSYADGLLSTGERISYRNKQHPFVFIWGARYAILALVIALVALWFRSGLGPDTASGIFGQTMGFSWNNTERSSFSLRKVEEQAGGQSARFKRR